jgi:hypothetical protein
MQHGGILMGCHQCWEQAYKMKRKEYKLDRKQRGEQVRKHANEPAMCPFCNQPRNTTNHAEEVWNLTFGVDDDENSEL